MSDKLFTGLQLPDLPQGQEARLPDDNFFRLYGADEKVFVKYPNGTVKRLDNTTTSIVQQFQAGPRLISDDWIIWISGFTTNGSQFTLHVTDDLTANGVPVFTDLLGCAVLPLMFRDTDSNNEAPWIHGRTATSTSITFQLKRSNQGGILLGGTYFGNLNNDNSVQCRLAIVGPRNPDYIPTELGFD